MLTEISAGSCGARSDAVLVSSIFPTRSSRLSSGARYVVRTWMAVSGLADKAQNFETTFRWREDANELMATAMLDQILYPIPKPFKGLVAQIFTSLIDYDSKFVLVTSARARKS
jgi:hypothetical protein